MQVERVHLTSASEMGSKVVRMAVEVPASQVKEDEKLGPFGPGSFCFLWRNRRKSCLLLEE